jgi:hypothetical protein
LSINSVSCEELATDDYKTWRGKTPIRENSKAQRQKAKAMETNLEPVTHGGDVVNTRWQRVIAVVLEGGLELTTERTNVRRVQAKRHGSTKKEGR